MLITDVKGFFDEMARRGVPEGRLLFAGDEDFLKRSYLNTLKRAVVTDEAFAPFNHIVYDGPEIDFARLSEAIKSPPMMSEYKLVEWRYADFSKMTEADLKMLDALAEEHLDYPYTVLAIVATAGSFDFGTPKKKSKLLSRYEDRFNILRLDKPQDNQLFAWLKKHFDKEGVAIGADTAAAMVATTGHSMDALNSEVGKLTAYVRAHGRDRVTPDDVATVSSSVIESDTFALSNAITEKNKNKLFRALEEMKMRRVEPMAIFATVGRTFSELFDVSVLSDEGKSARDIETALKMNPYKLKIYLSAVKKYKTERLAAALSDIGRIDFASKNGGVGGYVALEIFLSEYI